MKLRLKLPTPAPALNPNALWWSGVGGSGGSGSSGQAQVQWVGGGTTTGNVITITTPATTTDTYYIPSLYATPAPETNPWVMDMRLSWDVYNDVPITDWEHFKSQLTIPKPA